MRAGADPDGGVLVVERHAQLGAAGDCGLARGLEDDGGLEGSVSKPHEQDLGIDARLDLHFVMLPIAPLVLRRSRGLIAAAKARSLSLWTRPRSMDPVWRSATSPCARFLADSASLLNDCSAAP